MPPKRSGAPYRRIVVTFWTDPDVKNVLSLEEKAFLAYLFSNKHSHPCGAYHLPPLLVQDELGIERERMRELLEGPMAKFAVYDWRTEEVLVRNMAEHQIDGGLFGKDKRIPWVVTQLQSLHSEELVRLFHNRYASWSLPWETLLPDDGPPPEKPHNHAKKEGASDAPSYAPSDAPSGKGLPMPLGMGHGMPVPVPVPVPVPDPVPDPGAIKHPPPSSHSAGASSRRPAREDAIANPGEGVPDDGVSTWLPLARSNIVRIHGSADPVRIHDSLVGVGIEVMRYKRICELGTDPPDVIARAIAHLPRVTGLEPPVSLALWETDDGGLSPIYAECIGMAYKAQSATDVGVSARVIPTPKRGDPSDLQRAAREKLQQARAQT